MISEIKYGSYTASPSDYDNPDGDLALAIGAVCEDGSIKPIFKPSTVPNIKVPTGAVVLYIHTNVSYKNYILQNGESIYYCDESGQEIDTLLRYITYPIDSINSLGNTLMILANGEIRYYLFKDGEYHYLGNHIPNIDISFGLRGAPKFYGEDDKTVFTVRFTESNTLTDFEFSEKNKDGITSHVMSIVNKAIAEQAEDGKFCLPFFVRYALRLYDGSLVCHSAPILMNPATSLGPIVQCWRAASDVMDCTLFAMSCDLDYMAYYSDELQNSIDDWSDIIKSVDVFVSKPIYLHNQAGTIERLERVNLDDIHYIGALDIDKYIPGVNYDNLPNGFEYADTVVKPKEAVLPISVNGEAISTTNTDAGVALTETYTQWSYYALYNMFHHHISEYNKTFTTVQLPTLSDEDKLNGIKDNSLFYLLKSIKINNLSCGGREKIKIGDNYLTYLTNREVMKDDYLTHDRLSATYTHSYNNRMHLSGVSRYLYEGFPISSMLAKSQCNAPYVKMDIRLVDADGNDWDETEAGEQDPPPLHMDCMYINFFDADKGESKPPSTTLTATVFLKDNGKLIKMSTSSPEKTAFFVHDSKKTSWGCYVFYPNPAAYRMLITDSDNNTYDIELKEHEFLNGAYGLLDYNIIRQSNYTLTSSDVPSSNISISMENRLYSSAVNNPFYYPSIGVISVGTGKILGISAAVEALSEGQFGQFPLYAFTTDGIWALEVASNGTYSAKQPISRDVCISPDSITQIDKSVMFATNRGIMVISGSSTQCISDSLTSQQPFTLIDLPRYQGLLSVYNSLTTDVPISAESMKLIPFEQFLSSCKMLFDYTHQRVFVYNPAVKYSYVFSLKSKTWGLSMSYITSNVNSYPEALAMQTTTTASGKTTSLVDFSKFSSTEAPIMIVTRPFRLTSGDLMKTIRTIIQRGMINKNSVKQILYGSNDLYHWFPIWSSSDIYLRGFGGTSYKAFRLAVVGCLNQSQSISGCSVDYEIKLNNKLR